MSDLLAAVAVIVALVAVRWTDNAFARYWCGIIAIALSLAVLADAAWSYVPLPGSVTNPQRGGMLAGLLILAILCSWRFIKKSIGPYPDSVDFYFKTTPSHSKFAAALLAFYATGQQIDIDLRGAQTDAEVDAALPKLDKWYAEIQGWIGANMGGRALARFQDAGARPTLLYTGGSFDQTHRSARNNALNTVAGARLNLEKLADTKMFDEK